MTVEALAEGRPVQEVMNEGLIAGMSVVGEDFKHNVLYVPEVLIAARAMKAGMAVLKPHPTAKDGTTNPVGVVLMGADAAACMLAVDLAREDRLIAVMDIGTNTELILGNRERILAASCPAGPGRGGTRAAAGVVAGGGKSAGESGGVRERRALSQEIATGGIRPDAAH